MPFQHRRSRTLQIDAPWKDVPQQLEEQAEIGWYQGFEIMQEPLSRHLPSQSPSSQSASSSQSQSHSDDLVEALRSVLLKRADQWHHVKVERVGPELPSMIKCMVESLSALQTLSLIFPKHHNAQGTPDGPNTWQQQALQTTFDGKSSLQRLNVSSCFDDTTMQSLTTLLGSPSCSLTSLCLYNSSISNTDDDRMISTLAQGLYRNTSLIHLDVSYCNLRDDDVAILATTLFNHATLSELDLSGNYCRDRGIEALIRMLSAQEEGITNTTSSVGGRLTKLNLTNQHASADPRRYGPFDIAPLGLAIRTNTVLQSLDLSFNSLQDDALEDLMASLRQNTTLKELNLMKNCVSDKGVINHIAKHLPHMKGLQTLSLMSNRMIGDDGALALLDGIKRHNTTLTSLRLSQGFECQEELNYYSALNLAGRFLVFRPSTKQLLEAGCNNPPTIPLALWPHILARANSLVYQTTWLSTARADVLYYLLLHGPVAYSLV